MYNTMYIYIVTYVVLWLEAKLLLKHSQYRIMSSLAIIDANHMTQYLSLHWDTAQLNQQQ